MRLFIMYCPDSIYGGSRRQLCPGSQFVVILSSYRNMMLNLMLFGVWGEVDSSKGRKKVQKLHLKMYTALSRKKSKMYTA